MQFYHVTTRANAENILRDGFEGGWGDVGHGVYLYDNITSAKAYLDRDGWDGLLEDGVIISVLSDEPERVIPESTWPNPEDYNDIWWVELDEDTNPRWTPPREIVSSGKHLTEETQEIISQQWEDAWDLIYVFISNHEYAGPYNEMDSADGQPYPGIMMGGYPEDGFNPDVAEKVVEPLNQQMEKMGWHMAKKSVAYHGWDDDEGAGSPQTLVFIGWLPDTGKKVDVRGELFHVTRKENTERIMREGLKPSHGGSDFIRTKNARVYFVTDYYGVESVVTDLRKHRGDDAEFVVFRTWGEELPNHTFYDDMEVEGDTFVWTDQPVPASVLEFWGDADELLF